jgi:hypothetical protein
VWQLANLSGVEVTTTKCVSGQLAKEKIELNDESRIQRMLCKSARAEVLQMKARIEKESAEMETATEPATGSPAHGACNDHVPDQLELPRLESNEVLGLRVALAALEESTQRHESHLTKVWAQSILKELEHRELAKKVKFLNLQYSVLQEKHVLLKMRQPGLCVVPHPMCYGIDLESEATNL